MPHVEYATSLNFIIVLIELRLCVQLKTQIRSFIFFENPLELSSNHRKLLLQRWNKKRAAVKQLTLHALCFIEPQNISIIYVRLEESLMP